jgi:hypothetical protein
MIGLNSMWLLSAKALGWAVGRGPLATAGGRPRPLPQFAAVLGLPITPVDGPPSAGARPREAGAGPALAVLKAAAKGVLLTAVVAALENFPRAPRLAREALMIFGLYTFLGTFLDAFGAAVHSLLGLRVGRHFRAPYLSASPADFWSRRWNRNTADTLRFLVYDPLIEGRLVAPPPPPAAPARRTRSGAAHAASDANGAGKARAHAARPSDARRAAAACAAFAASGLLHEAFILHLRGRVSGYWLAFFTAQGPLLVIEQRARRWMHRAHIRVPRPVAVLSTLVGLLLLADALFFPDILKMGIPQRVIHNIHIALTPLRGAVGLP